MTTDTTDISDFLKNLLTANDEPMTENPMTENLCYQWRPARLSLNSLRVTSKLQRPIDPKKVDRIVREFDWRKVRPIRVCRYPDGLLAVADGQHTAKAIVTKFGDIPLPCEICDVKNDYEFRQTVADCNPPIANKVSTEDNFWIDFYAKDPTALAIKAACADCGYDLVQERKDATGAGTIIYCTGAIVRVHRGGGLTALKETMEFLRDTISNTEIHDFHVEGAHLFLKTYGKSKAFRRYAIVAALRAMPYPSIHRQVYTISREPGMTKARAFCQTIANIYNDSIGRGTPKLRPSIVD